MSVSDTEDEKQSEEEKSKKRDEIPSAQRKRALERDNHTCQLCSNKGAKVGGTIPLHVHHKMDSPDDCGVHDLKNLITLCLHCHNWFHNRPTPDTPPVDIRDAAADKLIPVDFEIIQILSQDGPLSTKEISERISSNHSLFALKERLWRTMGIDNAVDDQPQLLDQDSKTGDWGLPYQIDSSERRIPEQVQEIVQRTLDTLVRSALERGCDRTTVTEVFDLHYRTTYKIQYRGLAYDFPISMYIGQGRPPKDKDDLNQETSTENRMEGQQNLNNIQKKEGGTPSTTTVDRECDNTKMTTTADRKLKEINESDIESCGLETYTGERILDEPLADEKLSENLQLLVDQLNVLLPVDESEEVVN